MKEPLQKNLIRLLLPFGFSSLMLVMLLCGLSQAIGAEPRALSETVLREGNLFGLLDYQTGVSVCEQTQNLVLNPDFERNGEPWTDHWLEGGHQICDFTYGDPGHDSAVSAQVNASSPRDVECILYTPIEKILVEGGRSYDYSTWVQAKLSQGDAYLHVTFWSRQQSGWNYEGDAQTTPVTDTHGTWVKVTGSVTPTIDAQYARVELILPSSSVGWVRFDRIFFGLATCLDIGTYDNPDPVRCGQMVTYTIIYSNTGRAWATKAQVIETYDRYVNFEWAQPSPLTGTTGTWDVGDLLPGTSGTITVVVQVENDTGGQTSLINGALIRSDETVKPVYTTTTTSITDCPDGCALARYLPIVEQPGKPCYPTDYDVVLTNVGACGGQVHLTATSSLGWNVIITPSSPYILTPGNSVPVVASPVVPCNTFSGTVDVTLITATLECGSPCGETVTATATVTTTVIPIWYYKVYLPLVVRDWPPMPRLSPVDNADIDGSYNICWSAVGPAGTYYVLGEATSNTFIGATEIYTGTETCYPISNRSAGHYYYRVKVCGGWGCGGWSNVEEVGAWWEHEPNNSRSNANGPLISGKSYCGYPNDDWDCFKISVGTAGKITADLTNHTGQGVWLLLSDQDGQLVASDPAPPYHIEYIVPSARCGQYYICIYTKSGYNSHTPYILRPTFP